ncbi:MAG: ubiquinol-cytochrome c reductase iron-sulfur subunit [Bacteroidia bacterium]
MKRREFIKSSCVNCAASFTSILLINSCTTNKYTSNFLIANNKITLSKNEFFIVENNKSKELQFVILKPKQIEFPIVIYKLETNKYFANYLQCTHQGCELTPHNTIMVCPCHGAEFNTKGEVVTGPAETNLKTFNTTVDDENIYIYL